MLDSFRKEYTINDISSTYPALKKGGGVAGTLFDSDDNEGLSELHKVGVTNGPGADVSCRNKADASARSERVATDAG